MNYDPMSTILLLFGLSLLPIVIVLTTSFIKIAIVLILTRESLGVQQVPPNIVVYALSLILTCYIMGPVYNKSFQALSQDVNGGKQLTYQTIVNDFELSSKPVKQFLQRNSDPAEQQFFLKTLQQTWSKDMLANVKNDDFIILIPAFVISELTQAFKIGFLIYLPSIIIDIIISNILMAMGMMMMSPVTISLPIKLLLFIAINGWSRLIHILLGTY